MTSTASRPSWTQPQSRSAEETPRAVEIVEEEIHRFAAPVWLRPARRTPDLHRPALSTSNALVEQVLAGERGTVGVGGQRATSAGRGDRQALMSRLLH